MLWVLFFIAPNAVHALPVVSLSCDATSNTIWAVASPFNLNADVVTTGTLTGPVTFWANSTQIGSSADAPYTVKWMNTFPGEVELQARASDADGEGVSNKIPLILNRVQRKALLVLGFEPLTTGDQAIADRIASWGYEVTPILAASANSSTGVGFDLVFISESVSSNNVSTKFRDLTVPVISAEDYNYDEFGMTGPTIDTHYGFVANQTHVEIPSGNSPLSAGLPAGRTQIYTSIGRTQWGIPNVNATVGAYLDGDLTKPVLFGYRTGAMMAGGVSAPAPRTGFFLQSFTQEMTLLTPEGLALFDAAVRWTGGKETDELPSTPENLSLAQTEGDAVLLIWELDSTNVDGVDLEMATSDGIFAVVGSLDPTMPLAWHCSLQASEYFLYRVRSWNGNGYSEYSNVLRVPPEIKEELWTVE